MIVINKIFIDYIFKKLQFDFYFLNFAFYSLQKAMNLIIIIWIDNIK